MRGLRALPTGPGHPAPRVPAETQLEPAAFTTLRDTGDLLLGSGCHGNFPAAKGAAGPGNFPGAARHRNARGHGGAKGMSPLPLLPPPRGRGRGCHLEFLPGALHGPTSTGDPSYLTALSFLCGTPGPWQRYVLPTWGCTQPGFAEVSPQGRQPEILSLPILVFN